jgi:hypothetical protein
MKLYTTDGTPIHTYEMIEKLDKFALMKAAIQNKDFQFFRSMYDAILFIYMQERPEERKR